MEKYNPFRSVELQKLARGHVLIKVFSDEKLLYNAASSCRINKSLFKDQKQLESTKKSQIGDFVHDWVPLPGIESTKKFKIGDSVRDCPSPVLV